MVNVTEIINKLETADNFKETLQLLQKLGDALQEKEQPQNNKISAPIHQRPNPPTTKTTRQKANNKAIELLDEIKAKGLTRDGLTQEQLDTLAQYTGNGGGLTGKDGKRGSAHEYYTPKEIANGMWELAQELGFNGGKVLDPSAGTGLFTATSPNNAVIDSVELDETSGGIAQILNDGERSNTVIAPFEKAVNSIDDDSYDMVITNVPFGSNKDRGANKLLDTAYQNESLENYFILRSLEKIKPNGLAIFIVPTSVVSGRKKAQERLRTLTSLKAEFKGAYRLPNSVFENTGADVITDVIVLKKHSEDGLALIQELYDSGDIETLTQTNVLWNDFISGHYFKQAGKKFILGEVQQVEDTRWGGLKEKVVNTKPTAEIAKMLRKFGDSRIDWQQLEVSEPNIIEYQNGDTIFQNGKQMTYQDGLFVESKQEQADDDMANFLETVSILNSTPIQIIENNITFEQALEVKNYARKTGQANLLDDVIFNTIQEVEYSNKGQSAWQVIMLAKAIEQAISERGYGANFVIGEPIITEKMKTTYLDGKNSGLTGNAKQALNLVKMHYNKGKYSKVWNGDIDGDIVGVKEKSLDSIKYENQSLFVSREQFDGLYGSDIDPMASEEWFINAQGDIIHSDDYLVGSLSSVLKDIDEQIKLTDDKAIKDKLIKQKNIARERAYKVDVKKMEFDLRTPLISANKKVDFLKQYVSSHACLAQDSNGRLIADIDNKSSDLSDTEKLLNRMGDWLAKGTVTLGGTKLDMTDKEALDWLSNEINRANTIFNTWVKANDSLMAELENHINKDENLYFPQNSDENPLQIDGINKALPLHGYQSAFVRNQARLFGGINGFGVGLGKTLTALASTQHVQNIGIKKKTLFVVPNSVLSNWRKEAQNAYENMDDCIFIGLREKTGGFKVYSSKYDEDLLTAVDGKYRKIFCTYEAFRRIRLKENTIEDYARYLKRTDSAYSGKELKRDDEKAKGLVAELIDNIAINSNAPYLEDMNIDSVVIDEAHAFKNSITAPDTDNRVKYLSIGNTSKRGEDAQAKLFYIRGKSVKNDGVQLLTATPITNSPLEVYSMLCLTKGREAVNAMACGINGADDFISIMCRIGEETVPSVDGGERSQNVFQSLRNLSVLRNAIGNTATIKNAEDVGLSVVIPKRDEVATNVTLSDEITADLITHQKAYTVAKAIVKDMKSGGSGSLALSGFSVEEKRAYELIKDRYNEEDELLAHPFNLIHKMDVLIADSEFADNASWYDFDPSQKELAKKAIATYNKKKFKEVRSRLGGYTHDDNAKVKTTGKGAGKEVTGYEITVVASIVKKDGRERIVIDSMTYNNQQAFEKIAEKLKLKLNVTIPPKLASLLENFKAEMANPRGVKGDGTNSKQVKQIIFCDHLFLHNKISKILTEKAKVKKDKIVVVTGQTNNDPDVMIDIQDGFNAFGDDNKYQVIIANKKAEVGINLQRGTQAIHHLTTGWTPDSLEQRNGRGARQGNMTDNVRIYHYDADGTFDSFKRTMINKKDDWISSVLSNDDNQSVAISGGLSKAEQEALIKSLGDEKAIKKYQAEKDEKEQAERIENGKRRVAINLDLVRKEIKVLKDSKAEDLYETDVISIIDVMRENVKTLKSLQKENRKPNLKEKDQIKYDKAKAIILKKLDKIINNVEMVQKEYDRDKGKYVVIESNKVEQTAEDAYNKIEKKVLLGKGFKPSDRKYNWDNQFDQILRNPNNYNQSAMLIENSDYNIEHDEMINTAKKLIENSVNSVNAVAEEVGLDKLPDNAIEKITNGEAMINDENTYLEKGMFIVHSHYDGKFGIVVQNNNSLVGRYMTNYDNTAHYSLTSDIEKTISPNSDEYLDYVKKSAKIEDDYFRQGKLDYTLFSDNIPMVGEYRDKDIRVEYPLTDDCFYHISECPIGYVLPFNILFWIDSEQTTIQKALSECYKECGIVIDTDKTIFYCADNSDVEVLRKINIRSNAYNIGNKDTYIKTIAQFIKDNNLKIENGGDCAIAGYGANEQAFLLSLLIGDLETTAFDKVIAQHAESFTGYYDVKTDDMITEIVKSCFNNGCIAYDITQLAGWSNQSININLLKYVFENNFTDYNDDYSNAHGYLRDRVKALHDEISVTEQIIENSNHYADDDLIEITGNTMDWKDDIKAYAEGCGFGKISMKFRRRTYKKYAHWVSKQACWVVHYISYKKLIADHPKAEKELTIKKYIY